MAPLHRLLLIHRYLRVPSSGMVSRHKADHCCCSTYCSKFDSSSTVRVLVLV